jgi:hypothetical protein
VNEWVGGIRVVGQHKKEFDALTLSLTHVGESPAPQPTITKAATAPNAYCTYTGHLHANLQLRKAVKNARNI